MVMAKAANLLRKQAENEIVFQRIVWSKLCWSKCVTFIDQILHGSDIELPFDIGLS